MEIHPGRHEVRVDGEEVHLTASEFTILELLAGQPDWGFSRQQIIDQVRGYDYSITPRAVDVQIFGLRKKLGDSGACIETVRGIGAAFQGVAVRRRRSCRLLPFFTPVVPGRNHRP